MPESIDMSPTVGVRAKGVDRIEFTLFIDGKRYRPTLKRTPSEANLRRAALLLRDMEERIKRGTFNQSEQSDDREESPVTAKQHGHGVAIMLTNYAAWLEGATETDIAAIKSVMEAEATAVKIERNVPAFPLAPPVLPLGLPLERVPGVPWGRLSWRKQNISIA